MAGVLNVDGINNSAGTGGPNFPNGFSIAGNPYAVGTVSGRYFNATGTLSGTDSLVTYSTRDYDTNSAYSAGILTIPVAGKYLFNAHLISVSGGSAINLVLSIYKNGSLVSTVASATVATGGNNKDVAIVDQLSCAIGDQIKIEANDTGTSPSITSSNSRNLFTWALVSD